MRVTTYDVQLSASHQQDQRLDIEERLLSWGRRNAPVAATASPRGNTNGLVRLSAAGLAAAQTSPAAATGASDTATDSTLDPRLNLLKQIIEQLTGRSIKLLSLADLGAAGTTAAATPATTPTPATARNGSGFAYELHARYSERETTRFTASGTVQTADGRQISFAVDFALQRSLSVQVDASLRLGEAARAQDPLMIDFAGSGASLGSQRFSFDLDADGSAETLAAATGGSGYIVFDRNGNGSVDDGSELFGPASGDGFADLAALDSDGNGWIDAGDPAFAQLGVWRPDAHGDGTIGSLAANDIGALYLGRVATPFAVTDKHGDSAGELRASSIYLKESGGAGTLSQVDIQV